MACLDNDQLSELIDFLPRQSYLRTVPQQRGSHARPLEV